MNINATLSITYRPNEEPPVVVIAIQDVNSRIEIFEGRISYENFTAALATLQGRPFVEADFAARDAPNVGKYLEVKTGVITAPDLGYGNDERYERWLDDHGGEPGWEFSSYLGSQDSKKHTLDGVELRYRMWRYLETKPEPKPKETGATSNTKKKLRRRC